MYTPRPFITSTLSVLTLLLLQACSDAKEESDAADATPTTEVAAEAVTDEEKSEEPVEEIDPEEMEISGQIELKQYTVAYVGSGTVGGGTLTFEGKSYPFRIAGLGYGGFGVSSIDAEGVVYNLPHPEAFPGTYGNARLGMTAGDSGSGKLWLKSPTGVVIELKSEMRGLALASGVDGLYIEWDEDEASTTDKAIDGTTEVVGEGIEASADAVQKGVDNVKGWFKRD